MTPALFWLMVGSSLLATLAAIGGCVIREIAWHEMEELCLQKQRPELFGKIHEHRESMEIGAGILQMICLAFAITSTFGWIMGDLRLSELGGTSRILLIACTIAFVLVISQSWIPWAIAGTASPRFLYRTWRWWRVVSLVAYPFLVGEKFFSAMFARASGQDEEPESEEEAFEDEILSLASEATRDGHFEHDQREMIEGVMELDDGDVRKVMTPRSAIDALEINASWDEMLAFVVASGRTRIPIYDDKIDTIRGILFAKDLLRESLKDPQERHPLSKLMREPVRVYESTRLDVMLQSFLQGRVHMAVVRDEHGGVAGVVTIEDVLEEIVGEIVDEADEEEREQVRVMRPGVALVDGSTPIDRVNERLGTTLPEDEDVATIGGLIMRELNDIPRPGRQLKIGNVNLEIKEANRRSIRVVHVAVIIEDRPPES